MQQKALRGPPQFEVLPSGLQKLQHPLFGMHEEYDKFCRIIRNYFTGHPELLQYKELGSGEKFSTEPQLRLELEHAYGEANKMYGSQIMVQAEGPVFDFSCLADIVLPEDFTIQENAPSIIAPILSGSKLLQYDFWAALQLGGTEVEILESLSVVRLEVKIDSSLSLR